MLIHPSSGAYDLFVELFHRLYCSGSMCVGVTLWFGWGGVVSGSRLKHRFSLHPDGKKEVGDKRIERRARVESCQLMSNLFRFTGIQYATGVLCDTATQNITFPSIADLRKHKGSKPTSQKIAD